VSALVVTGAERGAIVKCNPVDRPIRPVESVSFGGFVSFPVESVSFGGFVSFSTGFQAVNNSGDRLLHGDTSNP